MRVSPGEKGKKGKKDGTRRRRIFPRRKINRPEGGEQLIEWVARDLQETDLFYSRIYNYTWGLLLLNLELSSSFYTVNDDIFLKCIYGRKNSEVPRIKTGEIISLLYAFIRETSREITCDLKFEKKRKSVRDWGVRAGRLENTCTMQGRRT